MVQSEDKKGARALIDEEYGRKFPLRVLRKDMDSEHYLLHIREVGEDDEKTLRLFEPIACKECETIFRIIDKYNDANKHNKGAEFCSSKCAKDYRERSSYRTPSELDGSGTAVIYKIANVKTRMVYIGKTTQAFTLRWYQHFYQNGDCKFHEAIKNSELTDWEFCLLEVVKTPKNEHPSEFVKQREAFWIGEYDSIDNGYNSVAA